MNQQQTPPIPPFNPEVIKRLVKAGEELRESARRALIRLNDVLREARLARERALRERAEHAAKAKAFLETPEVRELKSSITFHVRIIREREAGLDYVRALGDKARADMGLRPEFDPINLKEQ